MIDTETFTARVQKLEKMLHDKLGLRGKSLGARIRRAGRLLPKRLHRAGRVLAEAESKLAHPKLARQVDPARVEGAFADFVMHLESIDPVDRRKGMILGWLGALVFNLIVLVLLLILFLKWRGVI